LWYVSCNIIIIIDTFHRNLLRKTLKIKWPYKISNNDLYHRTNEEKWSLRLKEKRLQWFGHLMRVPEDTNARRALTESLRTVKKPRGKAKCNWIKTINDDLVQLDPSQNIESSDTYKLTSDRNLWRKTVHNLMKSINSIMDEDKVFKRDRLLKVYKTRKHHLLLFINTENLKS